MKIHFSKMHGLGNDFMIVDCINQKFRPTVKQIQSLSNRHFGIGFDQLLLVEPSDDHADFFYRIYNADGSEAQQCGNGARCFARYVYDQGLANKKSLTVKTIAGYISLHLEDDGQVTVDMGKPIVDPALVPFIADSYLPSYVLLINNEEIEISAISMGNPHCVIQVTNVEQAPVATLGPLIGKHSHFPEGVNVGFMEVIDKNKIRLRVYERGAGETLACGSGAAAAVVAGRLRHLLNETVVVQLPGGNLTINWQDQTSSVLMTGPAIHVFEGVFANNTAFS